MYSKWKLSLQNLSITLIVISFNYIFESFCSENFIQVFPILITEIKKRESR